MSLLVAYLGPPGSYTELSLRKHLPEAISKPCVSIAEVFSSVTEGAVEAGFVPLENMLQGPVSETLDLLYLNKSKVYIEKTFLYEIRHCIGIIPESNTLPREERLSTVRSISSHQQALGQCSKYIRAKFPNAQLCPSTSSGAAAQQVKETGDPTLAVIADRGILEQYGFEIIDSDIADVSGNQTRFAVIRRGDLISSVCSSESHLSENKNRGSESRSSAGEYATSIVIDPGRDRQGLLFEMLEVISEKHRANLLSIHSRPDSRGGFVFHLDLEGSYFSDGIQNCIQSLHRYCLNSTGQTAEIIICGSYPRQRFHTLPFQTIGIVGGNGRMGRWFSRFFQDIGLKVEVSDLEQGISPKELCEASDVILLSVPMSEATKALADLKPHLRAGQLIVENCSIKSCIIPDLLKLDLQEIEVLGIHTMFGENTSSIRGENIIITKTEKSGKKANALEDLFYKYGAKLTHATAAEHDARTAFVQALVHFAALCVADSLPRSFLNPEDIEPFNTPNSRVMLELGSRVLRQKKELLADIQLLNSEYPKLRKHFAETVSRLSEALDKKDIETYFEAIEQAKKFLEQDTPP